MHKPAASDVILVTLDRFRPNHIVVPGLEQRSRDQCVHQGFRLEEIYFHLAQRTDLRLDRDAFRRRRVVQVQWLDACVQAGKELSYGQWEIKSAIPTHMYIALKADMSGSITVLDLTRLRSRRYTPHSSLYSAHHRLDSEDLISWHQPDSIYLQPLSDQPRSLTPICQ